MAKRHDSIHSELKLWLDNYTTQKVFNKLHEYRQNYLKALLNLKYSPDNLGEMGELKGTINTLDSLLDLAQLEYIVEERIKDDEALGTIKK